MYLYEKKIVYLSLLENGLKKVSAGFVSVAREKDAFILDIHIKSEGIFFGRKYSLFLISDNGGIELGNVTGQHGRADAHRSFIVQNGIARFGEKEYKEEDIYGVLIRIDEQREISGYWQESENDGEKQKSQELSAADKDLEREKTSDKKISRKEVSIKSIPEKEIPAFLLQSAASDKWEQLQQCYKKVHPFGDERVFLSIEPKDFVVLQAPYQRLVNNSFLLHGFYNYRHMILGPDKELGNGEGNCFYLGVPGTYFEREKMVAIMFGFEGFECDGAVEIGKFGYYMRRVEL
ncbi:hypothetical protein [Parablautia muri]|uniref:Uncharacterized protein n=1 Tax=Parablautia muri TaxID=2320879 RepID=A0A9X5GQ96_9FIRM|nr:hypothetical protein [Parablautia muri]NBJ91883.1 hypothetical protein [Parablautia muri]